MSVIKDFEFGEGIFRHYIIKNIFFINIVSNFGIFQMLNDT